MNVIGSVLVLTAALALGTTAHADDVDATAAATASADAAPAPEVRAAAVDAIEASITAKVENINYDIRELTLRGPEGYRLKMQVGPEVTRFNEISKGDEVTVDYLVSVAVLVGSPSAVPPVEGAGSALVRNEGRKPSGVLVDTEVVTGTIDAIDVGKRTATLRGSQGDTVDVTIPPDRDIADLKPGDQVLLQVTRALAVDVRTPAKPAR